HSGPRLASSIHWQLKLLQTCGRSSYIPQPLPITAWRHQRPGGFSNSLMNGSLQHIIQVPHALPAATSEDAESSIVKRPRDFGSTPRSAGQDPRPITKAKPQGRSGSTGTKDSTSAKAVVKP